MNIATLTCLLSNDVCARVSCLQAFANRKGTFAEYHEDIHLVGMMTCNGCRSLREPEPDEDPGIQEKIDRLKAENVEAVHVGVCVNHNGQQCRRISIIRQMLEAEGIRTVSGTH